MLTCIYFFQRIYTFVEKADLKECQSNELNLGVAYVQWAGGIIPGSCHSEILCKIYIQLLDAETNGNCCDNNRVKLYIPFSVA